MVIKRKDMKVEVKNRMRGGEGDTTLVHLVNPETMKNARLLSEITIPVGASIGLHEHLNETEYYIILEGNGMVTDNGTDLAVGPQDVVVTSHGQSHSIRNAGTLPLKMLAVIVTY